MARTDLRRLRSKYGVESVVIETVIREIEQLTDNKVTISRISGQDKTVTIAGKDKDDVFRSETWDISEYLKMSREYTKKKARIDRQRKRYGIEAYELPELHQLINKESIGRRKGVSKIQQVKGLGNVIKTADRILSKSEDTGRNKIKESAVNRDRLLKARFKAFHNPIQMMKMADSKFKVGDYVTIGKRGGMKFKSKRHEREFYDKFEESIVDEDYSVSPPPGSTAEVMSDLYAKFVPMDSTTRDWMSGLTDDELVEYIREVQDDKMLDLMNKMFEGNLKESEEKTLISRVSQYIPNFDYDVIGDETSEDYKSEVERIFNELTEKKGVR